MFNVTRVSLTLYDFSKIFFICFTSQLAVFFTYLVTFFQFRSLKVDLFPLIHPGITNPKIFSAFWKIDKKRKNSESWSKITKNRWRVWKSMWSTTKVVENNWILTKNGLKILKIDQKLRKNVENWSKIWRKSFKVDKKWKIDKKIRKNVTN